MNSKLYCPVCCEEFGISQKKTPRLLKECGHTLCSSCLSQMIAQNPKIICPTCRIETMGKYLSDYPKNFAILELLSDSGQNNSGEQNNLNLDDKVEKGDQAKTETEIRKEKELEEMRRQEELERAELKKLGYALDEMTAEMRKLKAMEAELEREREQLMDRLRDIERKQRDVKQRREATQRDFEKIEERMREIEERKRIRENEHSRAKQNERIWAEEKEEKRGLKVLQDNSEEEKARLEVQVKELEEEISDRKRILEILDNELNNLRQVKNRFQAEDENICKTIREKKLEMNDNYRDIEQMKYLLESMFKKEESQREADWEEKLKSTEQKIMEREENLKSLELLLIQLDSVSKSNIGKVKSIQNEFDYMSRNQDDLSAFIYKKEMQKKSLIEKINELTSKKEEEQVKQKPLLSRPDEGVRDKIKMEQMKRKKEQQEREDQEDKMEAEIVAIGNMLKALEMELAEMNEMKNDQVAKGLSLNRQMEALKSDIDDVNGEILGQRKKLVSLSEGSGEKNEENINKVKNQLMELECVLAELMQELARMMEIYQLINNEKLDYEAQIKALEIRIKETQELLYDREMEKEKIRKTARDNVKEDLSAQEAKTRKEIEEKERLEKEKNKKALEDEICIMTNSLEQLKMTLNQTTLEGQKLQIEMREKNAVLQGKLHEAQRKFERLMFKSHKEGGQGSKEEINSTDREIHRLAQELKDSLAVQNAKSKMLEDELAAIECEIENLSKAIEERKMMKDSL